MRDKHSEGVALGILDDARMAADYEIVKTYIGLDAPFDVKTAYTNELLDRSIKMPKWRVERIVEPRIRTTVVGSYPVPEWLVAAPSAAGARLDATRVVNATQEAAGVDVVCGAASCCTASTSTHPRERTG